MMKQPPSFISGREPADHYPGHMVKGVDHVNSEENRERRIAAHRVAVAFLKPLLKKGDRIRATKGECCAGPATYTFAGWDGQWIVSKSGIDSIIPNSVTSINGVPLPKRENV